MISNRVPAFLRRLLPYAFVLSAGGCATFLATTMPDEDPYFYTTPVARDRLLAIGKVNQTTEAQIGGRGAIAFLGEKHTYLLTGGSEDLQAIVRSPIGAIVEIPSGPSDLFTADQKFWGHVPLRVAGDKDYTAEQLAQLEALGFIKRSWKNGPFEKKLPIEGLILAPAKMPASALDQLSHPRPIEFYPPRDQVAPANLKKIAVVPLAVAVDTVTAPVQILGFTAVVIGIEATGGLRWKLF
jgi:hypothetical protein